MTPLRLSFFCVRFYEYPPFQSNKTNHCQPVTRRMLSFICSVLQAWLSPLDFSMVWAAFILAFFTFLRCSKFTYLGVRKFQTQFDLSTDCITFQHNMACPQYMTVQLQASKTDVLMHRQSLTITRSSSTICAVMAMRDCFLLSRPQPGPLFYFQSGCFLTWGVVSHLLQDSASLRVSPTYASRAIAFISGQHQLLPLLACQTG